MAAHAACADAALADDRHWDAVAGADPVSDADDERSTSDRRGSTRRAAGCLSLVAVVGLLLTIARRAAGTPDARRNS
jgi:hypothetical protein